MRQYFIKNTLSLNQEITFESDASHHIKDVLRMTSGDKVRLVDTDGKCFIGVLNVTNDVKAVVVEQLASNVGNDIVCIAAMIKKDKWEYLIQKATELGATKIVPLISKRTVIDLSQKDISKKLERWNKIALEACQQCNRTDLCEVVEPINIKQIDQYLSDINLLAYEKENSNYISKEVIKGKSISFIIGPEGGFEEKEATAIEEKGFKAVGLGQRILRAETAVLYVLSIIDGVNNE